VIEQFFAEYWIFVGALLERSSDLLGVAVLNDFAAGAGYPFAAALVLSAAGFAAALTFLSFGRPGWGLAGLALGEELSALSLASAALTHGIGFDASVAAARIIAAVIAVCLISTLLKKALRLSRERVPAGR
jgi:hypothetical protein